MEFADCAVEIEKQLGSLATQYECVMTDEDDIGMVWNFVYEDAIEGFISIEKEAPPFSIPTTTIALKLADIADAYADFLNFVLEINMTLLNASLAIMKTSVEPQEEEQQVDSEENIEQSNENQRDFTDLLVLFVRLPFDGFEIEELSNYLGLLATQFDYVVEALDSYSEEME